MRKNMAGFIKQMVRLVLGSRFYIQQHRFCNFYRRPIASSVDYKL